MTFTNIGRVKIMPVNTRSQKGGNPKRMAVQMLKRIYRDLDDKNMPEDQFIRESLGALKGGKDRKKSPIIRPD